MIQLAKPPLANEIGLPVHHIQEAIAKPLSILLPKTQRGCEDPCFVLSILMLWVEAIVR